MKAWPFDAAEDGLEAILGPGDFHDALHKIDAALRALSGRSNGLTVDDYPGPPRQRRLGGWVVNGERECTVELARGDFYDGLDRDPQRFYVEVDFYDDGELDSELPVREADTAENAVAALAEAVREVKGAWPL